MTQRFMKSANGSLKGLNHTNQTRKIDRINQNNQTNRINQTNQKDRENPNDGIKYLVPGRPQW